MSFIHRNFNPPSSSSPSPPCKLSVHIQECAIGIHTLSPVGSENDTSCWIFNIISTPLEPIFGTHGNRILQIIIKQREQNLNTIGLQMSEWLSYDSVSVYSHIFGEYGYRLFQCISNYRAFHRNIFPTEWKMNRRVCKLGNQENNFFFSLSISHQPSSCFMWICVCATWMMS